MSTWQTEMKKNTRRLIFMVHPSYNYQDPSSYDS